ncbi:O-antigen ligase family protein, partial [Vibrio parahaemolyticus]|uniref:O-antigen ligase family protein n=1 Tax=Vibrio parahaemolyticus TaxID=670 RepID=UPI00111E6ABA
MTLSEGGGSVLLFIVIFYLLAELSLGKFNLIGILRKPSVILSLIFVFYTYIYGFRYGSTLELINAIKFLIVIVFFIVVGDKHRDDREFLILSIFFISFGIICSVIYPIIDNGFNLVGVRLSATNASPNNLATLSIFIVVFIYYIFKFSDKLSHNDKLILSLSLFSIFIIGVLSQSRGFLLGIVLVVFYTLLSSFNIRNIKTVIFVSLVSTLFLIIVINYLPETYQSFSERILNPKGGDVSNGRLELWIEYLSFVLDDILIFIFGFGSNDVAVRVGLDQVAHNYIIETLVSYGVLGTFVIFLIYVFSILDVTRKFVRLVIFLPFIIVNVSH